MIVGRFAPSPSGNLHLGNLRTALIAWCAARSVGGRFLMRVEDLTTGAAAVAEAEQQQALAMLGITHDGAILRQSEGSDRHRAAIGRIVQEGSTYPCYCSRREIRDAATAPHGSGPEGAYPGTCRDLTPADRAKRERSGRRPALRLRAEGVTVHFRDRVVGPCSGVVDDLVLSRADGIASYNLAVVIDDAEQAVDQVVRGDDLLETTPRQVLLQGLLGLATPEYAHVPLVLGPDGARLSKRHGSVGLAEQLERGATADQVVGLLAWSLGLADPGESMSAPQVLERFDLDALPRGAWLVDPPTLQW